MYNQELKDEFIAEHSNYNLAANQLINRFEKISLFEEMWQKDCSNFTIKEILDFYKFLGTPSIDYIMVINSTLSAYTNMCLNKNLVVDHQNHYLEMNNTLAMSCVNTTYMNMQIYTRKQLLDVMDTMGNPSDKLLVLAIFEGIDGTGHIELSSLKTTDLDGNMLSLVTGRTLTVTDELRKLITVSANTYEYYINERENKYHPDDERCFKKNINSQYDTPQTNTKRIHTKFLNLKKRYGFDFTIKTLRESGRISMINDYILETHETPFEVISKHTDISDRYGRLPSYAKYITQYNEFFEKV